MRNVEGHAEVNGISTDGDGTMGSTAAKGGSDARIRTPDAAPLTTYVGGGPVDRLSHGQQDPVRTLAEETAIRHQERQLCAAEILIVADRWRGTPKPASTVTDVLEMLAGWVARREVV